MLRAPSPLIDTDQYMVGGTNRQTLPEFDVGGFWLGRRGPHRPTISPLGRPAQRRARVLGRSERLSRCEGPERDRLAGCRAGRRRMTS